MEDRDEKGVKKKKDRETGLRGGHLLRGTEETEKTQGGELYYKTQADGERSRTPGKH